MKQKILQSIKDYDTGPANFVGFREKVEQSQSSYLGKWQEKDFKVNIFFEMRYFSSLTIFKFKARDRLAVASRQTLTDD